MPLILCVMIINHNFSTSPPQRAYPTKRKDQPGVTPIHIPAPNKLCPVFSRPEAPAHAPQRGWITF
jgi:hypothetical protein